MGRSRSPTTQSVPVLSMTILHTTLAAGRAIQVLWHEKSQNRRMPPRAAFTIDDLRPWLGHLILVDVLPDGDEFDVFYRVHGTKLVEALRQELTGKRLSDLQPPDLRKLIRADYQQVVTKRRPTVVRRYRSYGDRGTFLVERVLLPLSRNGRDVDQVLSFAGLVPDSETSPDRPASRFYKLPGIIDNLRSPGGLVGSILTALDKLGQGAILLTIDGTVSHMNDEAKRIVDLDDGFALARQRVRCESTSADRLVAELIGEVLQGQASDTTPRTVLVPRTTGDTAFVVWTVPVSPLSLAMGEDGARAILVVTDPDRRRPSAAGLSEHFGLTRSEAEVAIALSNGATAQEIAAARMVSINTVRSLRARAYGKLGVDSQVALSKLIGSLPQVAIAD